MVKKMSIELDEVERDFVIKGLLKVADEAEKLSAAAERINIESAAKEAIKVKTIIINLADRFMGREKML
jgi:hypothetical protein